MNLRGEKHGRAHPFSTSLKQSEMQKTSQSENKSFQSQRTVTDGVDNEINISKSEQRKRIKKDESVYCAVTWAAPFFSQYLGDRLS